MTVSGKRSVRSAWYISYLLVLLVPLIAALVIYSFAADALNRQIRESNLVHLQLLEQRMESSVEHSNRLFNSLVLSQEFTAVRSIGPELTPATRYQIYRFIQYNFRQMQTDQFIAGQFLHLNRSNLVLTYNVYQDARRANDVILREWGISDEVFADLIENPQDKRYLTAKIGLAPVVLYAQSLPFGGAENGATLVVAFSRAAIVGVLEETTWSGDGLACVLNQTGDVLLTFGNEALATPELVAGLPTDVGEHDLMLAGKRYVYFNTGMNNSGLRYLYIAPYASIYGQANLVQLLAVVALLAGLVLSLMLTRMLVRRNYIPVSHILQSLNTRGQGGNEYDRIISSIERDKLERSDLSARLEDNHRMLGGEMLDRFLAGRMVYNATTFRRLSSYGIEMDSEAYCVLCLQADAASDEDEFAVQDALAALFCAQMAQAMPNVRVYQSARRIPLIFVLGMDASLAGTLAEGLQACQTSLCAQLQVQLDMSLSAISGEAAQLPDLYRQADIALEYAQMQADSRMVVYPEQTAGSVYYYQVDDELMLIEAVRQGRVEDIAAILRGIADRYAAQPNAAMAQCLRFDLIATCYRVFAYADNLVPRETWWDDDLPRRLNQGATVLELASRVKSVLSRIATAMQGERSERKIGLSDRVCEYVDQHWRDDALSVATIAAHFGMHTSYVSRMFKEENGMGLLEYINRLRVERSLPMLRQGLSMVEIARGTGFSSDASYIRVFKQYMGTTPGKYREMGADRS